MSNLALTAVENVVELYRTLGKRAVEMSAESTLSPSVQTFVAIDSFEFLKFERDAQLAAGINCDEQNKEKTEEWRRHVQERIDFSNALIDSVEDDEEREYLRRVLLDAILNLSENSQNFLFEETADALVEKLGDSEGDVGAFRYALFWAKRLARLPLKEIERVHGKIVALCDSIDDQYEFERVMGTTSLGVSIGIERLDDEERTSESAINLHKIAVKEFAEISSEKEILLFYNDTLIKLMNEIPDSILETYLQDAYTGLKAILRGVAESLTSGKRSALGRPNCEDDDDYAEEALEDLEIVVPQQEIATPEALKDGVFLRAFVKRWNAWGTIAKILERAREALDTIEADPNDHAFDRMRLIYHNEREFYEKERDAWLELARWAPSEPDLEYIEKARRLVRLARVEFLYGSCENAKNAVRDALKFIAKLTDINTAVDLYKELIDLHLRIKKTGPAKKMTDLLIAKIGSFSSKTMTDFVQDEVFTYFLRLFEPERVKDLINKFESPRKIRRWTANATIYYAVKEFKRSGDLAAFGEILKKVALGVSAAGKDADPIEEGEELKQLATFVAAQFEDLAKFTNNPLA